MLLDNTHRQISCMKILDGQRRHTLAKKMRHKCYSLPLCRINLYAEELLLQSLDEKRSQFNSNSLLRLVGCSSNMGCQ